MGAMRTTSGLLGTTLLLAFAAAGCASQPAAPFDTLKTANLTAFRLQNYEPPQQQAAAPTAPGMIPGLPPQIQQWVQQGAQGLQQLIPPGLLPPGMLQQGTTTPAQPAQDVPRFEGFRILGQTQVVDTNLKEELADILGHESNFQAAHANCLYAEMGLSFQSGPGMMPNNVLISFSCNQVGARNFAWPFPNTGMKPDTVKELSDVVNKLWPPGT